MLDSRVTAPGALIADHEVFRNSVENILVDYQCCPGGFRAVGHRFFQHSPYFLDLNRVYLLSIAPQMVHNVLEELVH